MSHHVAALEQEFGLTLIDRTRRPVGLTEAGERLTEHAAAVLGKVSAAEDELRALAGLLTGTVRVGAFLSACTSFVPQALARFEAAHPDVEVELEQLEPAPVLRRLRAGELDIAVVWEAPGEPSLSDEDEFERLFLANDPYRVVLPPRHRLARRREIDLADLAGDRFIRRRPTSRPTTARCSTGCAARRASRRRSATSCATSRSGGRSSPPA